MTENEENAQDAEESVILFKKISPTQKEQPDSNADEIIAAANAAAAKRSDEPMPASIDEIGDGAIFGSDDTEGESAGQTVSTDNGSAGDGSDADDIE